MTAVATKQIRLAVDLALPIDIAVEKTALLGKSGRGKTYTAKRMVEEVLRAGVPVAVIDPTDVWYGLGAGQDGTAQGGLDVVIFGGPHGDLPLNEHAGKMLAQVPDGVVLVKNQVGNLTGVTRDNAMVGYLDIHAQQWVPTDPDGEG